MHINDKAVSLNRILTKLTDEERAFVSRLIEKDPLTNLYNKGVVAYMFILAVLLLWPFDFAFLKKKNNLRWIGATNGIEFLQKGQILSVSSTENLCGRLLIGTGFSLEVWVIAQNGVQSGPARIVSYSLNPRLRNFTMGQSEDKLVMRLRTTETDLNGVKPHLEVANVFNSSDPLHIVVTYDFSEQCVYINGERRVVRGIPGGRFSNWDPSYYMVLGNEANGDRPWLGKIFYVAIHNCPLGENEIRQNYLAGWLSESGGGPKIPRVSRGLVVRYMFDERRGDKVGDCSETHTHLDLYVPKEVQTQKKPFLDLSYGTFSQHPDFFRDVLLNIIAFIPVGFLFHAGLRSRYGVSLKISAFVFLIGTLFTFGIESLQHFSLTRYSSFSDVFSNMLGTALGIMMDRFYENTLKFQANMLKIRKIYGL